MTQRTGFVLHVRPDKIEEYVSAHRNVWPEMLDALRAAGIHNYTIFRAGTSVFGYFEAADLDFAAAFLEAQHGWAARGARPGRRAPGARADLPARLAERHRATGPRDSAGC